MYNYPHYKETDPKEVIAFMQAHPFAMVIGVTKEGRIETTQVPVLIEEKEGKIYISGHIARKSSHHTALAESLNALVVFTGPHSYVSGSWYDNPQQASTWNYIAVHARGKVQWMEEEAFTHFLKKLSLHFENYNSASSTAYDNLPQDYLDKLRKAIVGFEIDVSELDNVHKLSQNRDEKSYDNIINELEKGNEDSRKIGELMEKRKTKVFPPQKTN